MGGLQETLTQEKGKFSLHRCYLDPKGPLDTFIGVTQGTGSGRGLPAAALTSGPGN